MKSELTKLNESIEALRAKREALARECEAREAETARLCNPLRMLSVASVAVAALVYMLFC